MSPSLFFVLLAIAGALVLGAALILVVGYVVAGFVMHPPTRRASKDPAAADGEPVVGRRDPLSDYGLPFEEVAISCEDGLSLKAWYVPSGSGHDRGVLAVHGGLNDRRDFMPLLESLHRIGTDVLLIDMRGHGRSDDDGFGITLGVREKRDALAAARWLRARGAQRVGAIGVSLGACAALLAAADDDDAFDALVLHSLGYDFAQILRLALPILPRWLSHVFASVLLLRFKVPWSQALSLQYPTLLAARSLSPRIPVFVIHGAHDEVAGVEQAHEIMGCLRGPRELWVIEGLKHELALGLEPEAFETRVATFFDRNLESAPAPESAAQGRG